MNIPTTVPEPGWPETKVPASWLVQTAGVRPETSSGRYKLTTELTHSEMMHHVRHIDLPQWNVFTFSSIEVK